MTNQKQASINNESQLISGDPQNHSCKAEPIIYNATLRLGMHSGLFTKLGRVKAMDDCIERCCRSSNADVAYMLGPFCFAVKCKTKEMCKPSPAMYSDITSLNLNPAISFLNKDSVPSISQGMYFSNTSNVKSQFNFKSIYKYHYIYHLERFNFCENDIMPMVIT